MKKTLAIILIALMSLTCVFAEAYVEGAADEDYANNKTTGDTATFTVTLDVPASSFYGHYYGFTSKANSEAPSNPVLNADIPEPLATLALTMNTEDKTVGSDSIYVYWKVRSAYASKIEVKSTGLVNNDQNSDHVVTLNVKSNEAEAKACSSSSPEIVFEKELDGDGASNFGNQKLEFSVDTMTGADVGAYTATLTMVISTHA